VHSIALEQNKTTHFFISSYFFDGYILAEMHFCGCPKNQPQFFSKPENIQPRDMFSEKFYLMTMLQLAI